MAFIISLGTVQLFTAIGTILLALAAFISLLYPKLNALWVRPKLVIMPEWNIFGKDGLKFSVTNLGKSPAHKAIASIKVVTDEGDVLGHWYPPWRQFSTGIAGIHNGLIEAKYEATTIFPGQKIYMGSFEKLSIGNNTFIGLNAPPYVVNHDVWPAVFWELSPLPEGMTAPLKKGNKYFITISVYCEEMSHGVSLIIQAYWDTVVNGIQIGKRETFHQKDLKLQEKTWKKNQIKSN